MGDGAGGGGMNGVPGGGANDGRRLLWRLKNKTGSRGCGLY